MVDRVDMVDLIDMVDITPGCFKLGTTHPQLVLYAFGGLKPVLFLVRYLNMKAQQNGGGTAILIWPSVLNLGAGKVWGKWAYLGGSSQSTINSHQKLKMISTHKFVS